MISLNYRLQPRKVVVVVLLQEVKSGLELLGRVASSAYLLHCVPRSLPELLLRCDLVLVNRDDLCSRGNGLIHSLLSLGDCIEFLVRLRKLLLSATDHAVEQLKLGLLPSLTFLSGFMRYDAAVVNSGQEEVEDASFLCLQRILA